MTDCPTVRARSGVSRYAIGLFDPGLNVKKSLAKLTGSAVQVDESRIWMN